MGYYPLIRHWATHTSPSFVQIIFKDKEIKRVVQISNIIV